jgi:hypothetical protein
MRDPISESGFENLNHWISNSKIIQYEFNKIDMISNITTAIDKIKSNVNEHTEFTPYTFELKDFLQLNLKTSAN